MTDDEFDALTAAVFATPKGKLWLAEQLRRSCLFGFLHAEILGRIRRMRERWRTGDLTPR